MEVPNYFYFKAINKSWIRSKRRLLVINTQLHIELGYTLSCTALRKTTINSSRRWKLELAVKMNGELQQNQAHSATDLSVYYEKASKIGVITQSAHRTVHAYSRDSGSLPCDDPSNIYLRNILNGARVEQIWHKWQRHIDFSEKVIYEKKF